MNYKFVTQREDDLNMKYFKDKSSLKVNDYGIKKIAVTMNFQ